MDMNTAFDLEVKKHCPQAEVVYDLFHVVARYGRDVIDRIRVDQANLLREDKPARKAVKQSRWLLLRNRDLSAHVFGQVLVLPGRGVRLPFGEAGDYGFACDAAPANTVTVRVLPHPDPGWERLRWRLHALKDAVRELPVHGPED